MLNSDGVLPAGRHALTTDGVREHFVDYFPDSKTRSPLFDRWMQHRAALEALVPITAQWLDGSYVTDKIDPGDVDVVTLIEGAALDALSPGQQLLVDQLVAGHHTRNVWGVDSFLLPIYPPGHVHHSASQQVEQYWDSFWRKARDGSTKGYVEVTA